MIIKYVALWEKGGTQRQKKNYNIQIETGERFKQIQIKKKHSQEGDIGKMSHQSNW